MPEREYAPGQFIPGTQYKCVCRLGSGGFGSVYLVEHQFLEARAVLKVLHASLVGRQDIATRLHLEAKMLARIKHPNIVTAHDGGVTGEQPPRPYFVMEYLRGQTLDGVLKQMKQEKGIGLKGALGLIELLDGLEEAHTKHGVIHRDIKPANILLQRIPGLDGGLQTRPTLLDFGIAHLARSNTRLTDGMIVGTQKYAAPEQLRGDTPTPKTDLYSMGLVLYECLCGRGPFDDRGSHLLIAGAHVSNDPPPPLSRFAIGVPDDLEQVVMSMIAKDPERRPPSAGWLAARLREIRLRVEGEHRTDGSAEVTESTPLENLLLAMAAASRDAAGSPVPLTPAAAVAPPEGRRAAALPEPRDVVAESRSQPFAVPADSPSERHTARGAPVDREAPTHTSQPMPPPARPVLPEPHSVTLQLEGEDNVYQDNDAFVVSSEERPPVRPAAGERPGRLASTSAAVIVSDDGSVASARRDRRAGWGIGAGASAALVLLALWAAKAPRHATASAAAAQPVAIAGEGPRDDTGIVTPPAPVSSAIVTLPDLPAPAMPAASTSARSPAPAAKPPRARPRKAAAPAAPVFVLAPIGTEERPGPGF